MALNTICFVSLPSYGYFKPDKFAQTRGGGAKRQIHLLSQELRKYVDVHVVVGDYGQSQTENVDGITLHRAYKPNEGRRISQFGSLFKAMREANADVYVYRGNPRKIGYIGIIANILGADWAYNVANDADLKKHYDNMSFFEKHLGNWGIRKSKTIIVQTKRQQELLNTRFGLDSVIVPNGYPPNPTTVERGEYFLWIGRLDEDQKRPHSLLECAKRLPHQEFKIIGPKIDSEYTRHLMDIINEMTNVEYFGTVSPAEINEYYLGAIALVNTSAYEGFPNTYLESWRLGIPVVSLDVDPGRYLGDNCFSGYANGDIDRLCSMLLKLKQDDTFRKNVGRELKHYVTHNYDIETVSKEYLNALEKYS